MRLLVTALFLAVPLSSAAAQVTAEATSARSMFEPELRVIHEFVGENAGDQFGWIGRNAGDCDGDGRNDVLLSAPTFGGGKGRIYVYSSLSGKLLWMRDGDPGDALGIGIEGLGDVDGDGLSDVIAGGNGHDHGRGLVLVCSGKDGTILRRHVGEAPGDGFGRKVSGAGDIDGDGHADYLSGAEGCDANGLVDSGRAYLYSGKDGSLLLTLDGEEAGDKFGVAIDGWARGDDNLLVIGAGDAGEAREGRAYVFDLIDGEPDLRFTIESDPGGVGLARMFVSVLGDVDGDGFPDVYASDWEFSSSLGRVYVHSGQTGERLFALSGEHPGDGFGIGTADVGDVDGDGQADLLIGAWQNREAAPSGGKCYLYSGKDVSLRESWVCTVPGETFGFDTTGLGDVDGDGAIDYLITNAWSGIKGKQSGRAFLVAGSKQPD
jgi:hypothetical protein